MKILAIYNDEKPSAVDQWRVIRPLQELAKHVDWQIDHRKSLIPDVDKYKDKSEFTQDEMERAFQDVCTYDIVISTYQANPTMYTLLQVARDKAGTQYVMDVDDDLFSVNPDNPVWLQTTHEKMYFLQRMTATNAWITTTTEHLANTIRERRPDYATDSVAVLPNRIPASYQHPPVDNGEAIVVGYFGGSAHYGDLHRTGCLEALQRVMFEHKNVRFKCVGMHIDEYLPRQRVDLVDALGGDRWLNELYPTLNMDICLGPLEDNLFNLGKSNIKWQEATRLGAAFVTSQVGPYAALPRGVCKQVPNNVTAWYTALKQLVTDTQERQATVKRAQVHLKDNYQLEDHWQEYRDFLEKVYNTTNGSKRRIDRTRAHTAQAASTR